MLSAFYDIIYFLSTTIYSYYDSDPKNCVIFWVFGSLFLPLSLTPQMLRCMCFSFMISWNKAKSRKEEKSWHSSKMFLIKPWFLGGFLVGNLIIQFLVLILVQNSVDGNIFLDVSCASNPTGDIWVPSVTFYAMWLIFYIGFCGFIIFSENDAFHIKKELLLYLLSSLPLFLLYFFVVSPLFPYDFPAWLHSQFPFQMIVLCTFFSTICYPLYLLYQEVRAPQKHKENSSNEEYSMSKIGGKFLLAKVLNDSELCREFTVFCVRSFCVENILFLEDVARYEGLERTQDQLAAAQKICQTYFSGQSSLQINIDATIYQNTVRVVDSLQVDQKTFEDARHQVFEQLNSDAFVRWRQSPEFAALTTKIIL